jgi:hypothetical protein
VDLVAAELPEEQAVRRPLQAAQEEQDQALAVMVEPSRSLADLLEVSQARTAVRLRSLAQADRELERAVLVARLASRLEPEEATIPKIIRAAA